MATATPAPPPRNATLSRASMGRAGPYNATSLKNSVAYHSLPQRPQTCRPTTATSTTTFDLRPNSREVQVRRWDGASRSSSAWDGLRKDFELWHATGNCLVHLYGRGQSRRGPAFKLPMDVLRQAQCQPLFERFLRRDSPGSPGSDRSSSSSRRSSGGSYFAHSRSQSFEIYIPSPAIADKSESFLYHIATRNFFAWIFGRSLVGSHLGGALVGLMNSMTEFRRPSEDNMRDILAYIDEEGYGDMRNTPDHALGLLFFAQTFQLKDMWLDAFTHCVGMHDRLPGCPGFEHLSVTSRALITRSRMEMDVRLQNAGRKLDSFLSEDLSDAHFNLSPRARGHLDKFRTFLQSFYIAKFGYYPPSNEAFPKETLASMTADFQKLYNLLVDTQATNADEAPGADRVGIRVHRSVRAFDLRHKHASLPLQLPLLPESRPPEKSRLTKRLSFLSKADKLKPDPRLLALSAFNKATNQSEQALYDCALVRAYRSFEKECIFSRDKNEKLCQIEARKVRWILIYTVLQTLLSVTTIPKEVSDTAHVPYHLCALTAGCPQWKVSRPLTALAQPQAESTKQASGLSPYRASAPAIVSAAALSSSRVDPDNWSISDKTLYSSHRASVSSTTKAPSMRGTVRGALRTLGNMPELAHPKPHRASFHEIVVTGYGNGLNATGTNETIVEAGVDETPMHSHESTNSISSEELSSGWSAGGADADEPNSPRSSVDSHYSSPDQEKAAEGSAEKRQGAAPTAEVMVNRYCESVYEDSSSLRPHPLVTRKSMPAAGTGADAGDVAAAYMKVTHEVRVEYEDAALREVNPELAAYLGPN